MNPSLRPSNENKKWTQNSTQWEQEERGKEEIKKELAKKANSKTPKIPPEKTKLFQFTADTEPY